MIPESPRDTESAAERKLFDRFRHDTTDEVVAFHSVAWLVPGKGRPRQGESDFILAHPRYGVVTLEVKGGGIRYDGSTGNWYSSGRDGETTIKDPVRQAHDASFLLDDVLARARRGGSERVSFGHAVAFPDTNVGSRALKPDLPAEIVIDRADLSRLDERLDRLFRHWHRDRQPLGGSGIAMLEAVLAKSFELDAPLAYTYADEHRELLKLTEEQYSILDLLARHPRAAIAGCAGSGKTFLAAEKARRLARNGFRVLVLAYNRFLSQHLRRGMADVAEVDVYSFDGLCRAIISEAGIDFPEEPERGEEGPYYRRLREEFANATDIAAGRYGALVVDEAQDFDPEWWTPLQLLLENPDESPLYVFYDDNQRLFPVPQGLPVPGPPFELSVNCRNTKRINKLVRSFYDGSTVEARGPEGLPVDMRFYGTESELLEQLDAAVRSWVEEAGVAAEDIALLTGRTASRSALWRVASLGGVTLTDDPWEKGKILRSSIHRFKGLERLVVGVTEIDGTQTRALYVGFSRPSVFLSIFCPESARHRLPKELAA